MGTFDGIQIGSTGIAAQRRGVETAGQNIANVNTQGYSRQRVDITPDSGPVTPAFFSTWDGTGLGVRSVEIERLRSAFVDQRVREELAKQGELQSLSESYRAIESILNEPSDTGLSAVIADFLSGWDDVANQPNDVGARSQLLERAETLAGDIRQISRSLRALQDNEQTKIAATVDQVNADAIQVAKLNESIVSAQAAGLNANELYDQRDLLLEGIVSKVGGIVRNEPDGTASLFIGGTALVRGRTAVELRVEENAGVTSVLWDLDGRAAPVAGEVGGMLTSVNEIIPDHLAKMDGVANQLMTDVNALHTTGFDLNGDPGLDFFVMGLEGIELNAAIAADPDLVAASDTAGTLGGSVAQQIADMSGTDDAYREMIVRLGVLGQNATRRVQLQDTIVEQVRGEQEAASGVNLDEELSDLVRFQRAYEASSRFISTIDEMLNTLINNTGRVGR